MVIAFFVGVAIFIVVSFLYGWLIVPILYDLGL
jgi:hypothetical protein